jgi:hypothetical protein
MEGICFRRLAKAVYHAAHSAVRHASRYDQSFDREEANAVACRMVYLMLDIR